MKTHLARRAMLVDNKYVSRTLLKVMFQLANKIKFVFLAMTVLIFSCQTVARMRVPKLAKNGSYSLSIEKLIRQIRNVPNIQNGLKTI